MVFTQILCRIAFLLWVSTLVSCTTYRTLPIEILEPAKIVLEPGKKVALLDRNIRYPDHKKMFINYIPELDRAYAFQEFSNGINYILTGSNYLDTALLLQEKGSSFVPDSTMPSPLNIDSVRSLCETFHVDYLISVEVQFYNMENRGSELKNNWFIRLYAKDKTSPLDSILLQDRIDEAYISNEEFAYYVLDGTWGLGVNYAERIVPHWGQTERRVYCKGKVLGVGDACLQANNPEEAYRIWFGAMQIPGKTAILAAMNLAWLYENNTDFEGALSFLLQAQKMASTVKIDTGEKNYLEQYIEIIRKRIADKELLDQQQAAEESLN